MAGLFLKIKREKRKAAGVGRGSKVSYEGRRREEELMRDVTPSRVIKLRKYPIDKQSKKLYDFLWYKSMEYTSELRRLMFLSTLPIQIIGVIIIVFLCLYIKKHSESREAVFYIILLTFVASIPEITDFLREGHDLRFHLDRIENIKNSLLAGKFPVRMNYFSSGNAGTATPSMYPELFLYIPAILRILGVPQVFALKFFYILINLSCAYISYFSVRRITKSKYMGLIYSAIYTLCIYRLENIYLRHAMGEILAMVFIPLVMLGIYETIRREYKYWYLLVLGITGIVQSHTVSVFLTAFFLLLYCLINIKHLNKARIIALVKTFAFTIGLNLWFVIPFFTYAGIVIVPGKYDLSQNSVYLGKLFSTFVKNTGEELHIRGTTAGEMPLTLGGIIGLGLIAFIYTMFVFKNKRPGVQKIGKTFFFYGIIALFMSSVLFPWYNIIPLNIFYVIQFAWRFLAFAAPLLSFPACIGIYLIFKKLKIKKQLSVFITVCICIAGCAYYLDSINDTKTYIAALEEAEPWPNIDYQYWDSDPEYTRENSNKMKTSQRLLTITSFERNNDLITISWENKGIITEGQFIDFPLFNFPGYVAEANGKKLPISSGNNSFIRVHLPKEQLGGIIKVYYKEPGSFILGNIISLISVLVFFGSIYRGKFLRFFKPKTKN